MPSLKVSVPHTLTVEEAMGRIRTIVEEIRARHSHQVSNLQEDWTERAVAYSFSAMGFSTSGNMEVAEEAVHIESKIPLAAVMFRGQIEERIKSELGRLLS